MRGFLVSVPYLSGSCGTPNSLVNGQRSYTNTIIGSTVTYTCILGYRLTAGSFSRTCQSSGLWSGSHPTCSRKFKFIKHWINFLLQYSITLSSFTSNLHTLGYCGYPGTPTNGRKTGYTYTQGNTVTYSCNTGYSISGSSSRTCLSNGQWSGSPTSCPSKLVYCSLITSQMPTGIEWWAWKIYT